MGYTNYTKFGLIFFIVGTIMVLISTFPLLFLVQELYNMTDVSTMTDFSGMIAIVVLGIVSFIGLIFYLVAYILMCVGGIGYREYGNKHRKFLIITLILLITIIALTLASSIHQMILVGEAASSGDLNIIKNIYYLPIITAVLGGLFYLLLLHELEDLKGKIILYIAVGITIAIAVVIAFLNLSNFEIWAANTVKILEDTNGSSGSIFGMDLSTLNAQTKISQSLASESLKYSVYGIIPSFFQLVALIIPFYNIHTGKLKMNPKRKTIKRVCSNCGFDVPNNSETCPKCGKYYGIIAEQQSQTVPKFCTVCGHQNESGKNYCEECGNMF